MHQALKQIKMQHGVFGADLKMVRNCLRLTDSTSPCHVFPHALICYLLDFRLNNSQAGTIVIHRKI